MPHHSFTAGVLKLEHYQCDPLRVIEQSANWIPNPPRLVLDLSKLSSFKWDYQTGTLSSHRTVFLERRHVMLFGQNHLVDTAGRWSCESNFYPQQYLDFYSASFYDHFYPGVKPKVFKDPNAGEYFMELDEKVLQSVLCVENPVFLSTPLEPDNWGRWLCTVLMKLRFYRKSGLNQSMKLFCRAEKPWQKRIFDFMHIDPSDIFDHQPGYTYFCEAVYTLNYSVTDFAPTLAEKEVFNEIIQQCAQVRSPVHDRIFVSRAEQSKRSSHYRVLSNEAELIARLSELNFAIIEPDQYIFEEQVRIFSQARVVVGLGGSGMFNTIFCRPGTTIIDLEASSDFVTDHARLFAAMDLDYSIIFGQQDIDDPTPIHKRWEINVSAVCDAIKRLL